MKSYRLLKYEISIKEIETKDIYTKKYTTQNEKDIYRSSSIN